MRAGGRLRGNSPSTELFQYPRQGTPCPRNRTDSTNGVNIFAVSIDVGTADLRRSQDEVGTQIAVRHIRTHGARGRLTDAFGGGGGESRGLRPLWLQMWIIVNLSKHGVHRPAQRVVNFAT